MSKLIQKAGFLNPNRAGRYMNYIATRDGVELARKHRLPEPIIDMIRQHHGDTPVMYFYAKAVKMLGEENVVLKQKGNL